MKVNYKFVTGEAIEIEVNDALNEEITQIKNYVYNNNRRETRRHTSYSDDNDKRDMFMDETVDVEEDALMKIENSKLTDALEKLLPQQRELLRKVFFENKSITQIAKDENVHESSVRERLERIYRKLKKFLV